MHLLFKYTASALLALGSLQSALYAKEIVTNPLRNDGFGAQFQSIIASIVYAELNDKEFRYTPFSSMEHNYDNDPEFIIKKEKLINLIGNFEINEDPAIQSKITIQQYINFFERNLPDCANSASLRQLKTLFRENKHKEDYFDSENLHIAVHIRRPNSHDSRSEGADTPDALYISLINFLRETYEEKHPLIHIYSQGNLEDFKIKYFGEDIRFHLNTTLEETYASMVLADVLVAAPSSFSYTAAMLSDGIVYYVPFWHPPFPHWISVQ